MLRSVGIGLLWLYGVVCLMLIGSILLGCVWVFLGKGGKG